MNPFLLFKTPENPMTYASGKFIFKENQDGDSMFVVMSGEVELYREGHLIEIVRRGGIFGELSLIDHKPRCSSALAATDVEVECVSRQRFDFLMAHTPIAQMLLLPILAERLRKRTPAMTPFA